MAVSFNLVDDPWIPVLGLAGEYRRVGIAEALREAGGLRAIATSSALDEVSVLRFLVAVAVWCRRESGLGSLESPQADPGEWLGPLRAARDRFELFGAGPRFYQDGKVAAERPSRPIADLFPYLPGATAIRHFRHTADGDTGLCPSCCAIGLVRLPSCTSAGGSGLSPSINNAPPAYIVPVGATLLEAVCLALRVDSSSDGQPAWLACTGPPAGQDAIALLDGLTWQPRRVWLEEPKAAPVRACARCGSVEPLVSRLVFHAGRSRKADPRPWRDPHVAVYEPQPGAKGDGALRGAGPVEPGGKSGPLWARLVGALADSRGDGDPPVPALGSLSDRDRARVRCFVPFTDRKAKWYDERREDWDLAGATLRSEDTRAHALRELAFVRSLDLRGPGLRACGETVRHLDLLGVELHSAHAAHRLRTLYDAFVHSVCPGAGLEPAVARWRDAVREVLDGAPSQHVRGSPLRRREAVLVAQRALDRELARAGATAKAGMVDAAAGDDEEEAGDDPD